MKSFLMKELKGISRVSRGKEYQEQCRASRGKEYEEQ
jgi:hypothetical protein